MLVPGNIATHAGSAKIIRLWPTLVVLAVTLAAFSAQARTAQSINFGQPANRIYGAPAFAIAASASSGLAVSITALTPAVCKVSGNTVSLLAAGTCKLRASQSGDATYSAAANVDRSFSVAKAAQTIAFTMPSATTYGSAAIALTATATSGLAVSFASITPTLCTISSKSLRVIGAGNCVIRATQPGNANYDTAKPVDRTIRIAKSAQTINFGALVQRTYGGAAFKLTASASSKLPVTIASTTPGNCSVNDNSVSLLAAGTCALRASQPGNVNFNAAPTISQKFTIAKAGQTINFPAIASHTVDASPFALEATAASGLALTFVSTTTSVCRVAGTTLTMVAVGNCTIRASQPGNGNYLAASQVSRTFAVTRQSQTIDFAGLADHAFGDAPVPLTATSSSGLAVTFSSRTPSTCSVTSATVRLVAAGTCTIRASQPGNALFAAAASVDRSFSIGVAAQAINFSAIAGRVYGDPPFGATVSSSSGLTVTLVSNTPAVCSVTGATISLLAAGTCTLHASQSGDAHFSPALPVDRSFAVAKASQTISFAPIDPQMTGNPPFNVTAIASSGLPVQFSVSTPSVCSITASTLTIIASGDCRVVANQSGNGNIDAAPAAAQTFIVSAAGNSISFDAIGQQSLATSPVTTHAVASSALPVTLATQTPETCAVTGPQVSLIAAGSCTIRATQPGNAIYPPAIPVDRSFAITKIAQTIAFPRIDDPLLAGLVTVANASASSGLPVHYASLTPATCGTEGGTSISLLAAGVCRLRVSQPGDARYAAAISVDSQFNIVVLAANVTFDSIGAQTLAASPLALSAHSPAGLKIVFSAWPREVCSVNGAELALVAPGHCSASASESSDGVHPIGAPVTQSFVVLRTPAFMPESIVSIGAWPTFVLPGRFHGGAAVDLVVPWQNEVAVLSGNGAGSFSATGRFPVGVFPEFGATADFNNDGHVDVAISYIGNGKIGVELGNGNAAFAYPFTWPDATTPAALAVADIDNDGNIDLVVSDVDSGGIPGQSLTLLFGNGDGSFGTGSRIPTCRNPSHMVVADFNGDVVPDFAMVCPQEDAFTVIVNHSNGAHDYLPSTIGVAQPYRIATGDLDDDGNADIVVVSNYGFAQVYLGDGKGYFRKTVELDGVGVGDPVIADLNADGIADIAISASLENRLTLLAGAGDGTFAAPLTIATGNYPTGLAAVDIDSNGSVDLLFANALDGTVAVLRNTAQTPALAHVVAASVATQSAAIDTPFNSPLGVRVSDAADAPISGVEVRFELPRGAASASFANGTREVIVTTGVDGAASTPRLRAGRGAGSYVAKASAGGFMVDFTLTNQADGTPPVFVSGELPAGAVGGTYAFALVATGSPTPTFSLSSGELPPGLSLTPTGALGGVPTLEGTFTGMFSASNGHAPDAEQSFAFSILTSSQTIAFNPIADQSIEMQAVTAIAKASSGLPVSLQTLTPTVCAVGGTTIQLLKTGICTIGATQSGNVQFAAAATVERSFDVTRGTQSVKLTMPQSSRLFSPPAFIDSSASSGLPVELATLSASVCVVVDNAHVSFIARGTCTLRASQPGNEDYDAAEASAGVQVAGAAQSINFQQPRNGRFGEPTLLLATASSGLPITLESLTPAVCVVANDNMASIGNDPGGPSNACTIRATQGGNDVYAPANSVSVTFPFGFDANLPQLPPPVPHIVYATYLGGLGRDIAFDVVAGPDGSPFIGGVVGTSNFPKLSSQQYSNAGLGLVFVSKLQSQHGSVDFSAAVGAPSGNTQTGVSPEIAALQSMAMTPSGEVIVAAYPGGADFPRSQGNYVHQGSPGIYRIDTGGNVHTVSASLDPGLQTIRAIASDRTGAIYVTGVARPGLATTAGAAIASNAVASDAPYLLKISPDGSKVYATYLTIPNSRNAVPHDSGQGKNDFETTSFAVAVDDAGNAYVAGQSTAADFPATTGALDTNDHSNRDAFVVKVNAAGSAIDFVARIGFGDVDRATAIGLEPDGSIIVAGKSASADDFSGGYSFQISPHFSQNNQQTLRVDREFGFIAQIDALASRVVFMAATGSFGGDLVDKAFEPMPRPLKIAIDRDGYIYVAGTGANDRTLPLMGLLNGMPAEGVYLMKVSPNGGQRYATYLGEGVATGVATDGFGNTFVTGYAKGDMPTVSGTQADCTIDNHDDCLTPFVIKVNDAEMPVTLKSPTPSIAESESVVLTASVGDRSAAGSIDFLEGGVILASVPLVAGTATYSLSPTVGFHYFSATFHGSGYANGMSSVELRQAVQQRPSP